MPDFAMRDPNNLLLQQPDGKFVEAGDRAGIANNGNSRGAALADFNLDGLVDLVVVNRRAGAQVWRNAGAGNGRFIEVRLAQDGPNRDGVGAWVEVRCDGDAVMRREITVGGGHAGGELGWRHFGLGDSDKVEVRVLWPDGTDGGWQPVEPGGFYLIERGRAPKAWTPG
jgi:hypothetical protein